MKTKSLSIIFIVFALLSASTLNAQIYADQYVSSGPCHPVSLLCQSGVTNPTYAVDFEASNYALMQTEIGIGFSSFLKVRFSSTVPGGYMIGVVINQDAIPLTAEVLGAISVRLFDEAGVQVASKAKFTVSSLDVLNSGLKVLRIYTKQGVNIKTVKITLNGLVTLLNNVRIYGVFSAASCPEDYATTVFADGPCHPIVPIICPGGVVNPANSVSGDNTDYAVLTIPIGIVGTAYLDLSFSTLGKAGERVGFEVAQNSLPLDVNLLGNLNIKAYDASGNVIKQKSSFSLADLEASVVEPGRYRIGVTTTYGTYQIARVRVTLTSLVSVLSDLRIYKAFRFPANYFGMTITANGPLSFCAGGSVKLTCPGTIADNTFQWYKNNSAIGGATGKSYTVTTAGAYHVARAFEGCQSVSFFNNVTVPCRQSGTATADLIVSPNPFSESFEISLPAPEGNKGVVKITTITGKLVSELNWDAETNLTLGSQLAPGVYMVNVDDGYTSRFIKVMKLD